jgi:hypothetical protein
MIQEAEAADQEDDRQYGVIPTNVIPGAICDDRVKNDRF